MWKTIAGAFNVGASYRDLPPRVQTTIVSQQDNSEIVISVIQLAIVVVFGTFYLLAPKTFPPEVEFKPVPWVLGAYLCFTLMRLLVASQRRLPDWFVAVSTAVDIAMLLGMIWSFHLQYMQPASFFLKTPTILYIFIFIALRALRFQMRFILLAGVVAALGWFWMVVYVVTIVPGDTMVTRDYVTYLTSNSVLIGAEIDKVLAILAVTAILAMATARARALLVQSVAESAAADEMSRFFSPGVASQIRTAETQITAGQGIERDAAILYLDLRGFTKLAAASTPDQLIGLLTDYQGRMVPLILRHGGSVDKFLGDGIMATFGATAPSETYAADAVRAIDAMLDETRSWNDERQGRGRRPVDINWAVATGPVVFGAVGDETRLEFTVIGEAANLAAKLEKHNKAESSRALATAETYTLAQAQGYARPTRPEIKTGRTVIGVDEAIDLAVLA